MSVTNTPKDGDFASYIESLSQPEHAKSEDADIRRPTNTNTTTPDAGSQSGMQTIEEVLLYGEEPTEELLTELAELNEAQPLSDEELERQALEHPGADGDPGTPE
jgi:hypothetical protein